MSLKDASAYNIQFIGVKPKHIDTLSFDMYTETPWVAYGQFCRHFLAPLMLMAYVDERLGKMMQSYIDGIPLDLADGILRGKGGFAVWQHIHLHARAIKSKISERRKPDVILMLAVVHHLAISNNLPLNMIAEWLVAFLTLVFTLFFAYIFLELVKL